MEKTYKICVYIPETHVEEVKTALFKAGAGKIGNYDCCAWQTKGHGQFRPLEDAQPFVGTQDCLETVIEYKVEIICSKKNICQAIDALKQSHPYETPAFDVFALESF